MKKLLGVLNGVKDLLDLKIKIIIAISIIMVVCILGTTIRNNSVDKTTVLTKASLEKIIEVSELSTLQAVYNGIAERKNYKNSEKVDYYVSYEAIVKAGFDFSDLEITIEDEIKQVSIIIPEIKLTETIVDITSLDYMFINEKCDTSTISEEAYKLAIKDVCDETDNIEAVRAIAHQNAEKFIQALVSPFIEQIDPEYTLIIT